jgi:site-specific recombinase XerD
LLLQKNPTATIRNKNTRRAYYRAACRLSEWCERFGVSELADVKLPVVFAYIEWLGLPEPQGQGLSKPSVKQHLAALRMLFDYCTEGRRAWVRLHEKGGKEHGAPCHHKLEAYLDEYIRAAGIANDEDGPLFRTTGRSTGIPHRMTQQDGYRMTERRAREAGIKTKIGNHSLRATGITDYLKSDGSLAEARKMANHAGTCTTQLDDRRGDSASLGEYEKVGL